MSLYLQRLLDRAAAPPARVAAAADPLLVTGSPILTFDQRLASAEMADDFSILGATPDLPEATEDAPPPAPLLARQNLPDAPPPSPAAAVEPRTEHPSTALPTRPAGPATPDSALPEFGKAAETGDSAPRSPRRVSGIRAVESPRQSRAELLEPSMPTAQPLQIQGEPERPSFPTSARADPSSASTGAVPGRMRASTAQAGVRDRPPPPETEPAPAPPKVSEARPLPSAKDAVREAPGPAPEPAEAKPAPAAEPVVAPIPPLAPPPRGLSAREVERMIDEAIGAERERGAARQPATLRTQPAQAPVPQGEAPAKRPATAVQASLIGSLESSRFRPMLFGVRRR